MKRPLILALVAIAAIGGYTAWSIRNNTQTLVTPIASVAAQDGDIDTSGILEMSIGNPDAKVTVIEYASFTCPHCRSFHASVLKDLQTNYIDTGKINFVYR